VFAWYIGGLPTYAAVYGTFATLPLALIWVYWSWLVVLGGAMVAAWLPALRAGVLGPLPTVGGDFLLGWQLVGRLATARGTPPCGLDAAGLVRALSVDPQRVDSVLQRLEALGWVGQVEPAGHGGPRWALLIDPQAVSLAPLVDALLLDRSAADQVGFPVDDLFRGRGLDEPLACSHAPAREPGG
jgi:membrane protein